MGEKLEMDPAKTSLAISILLFALIILAGCGSFATQTPATTSSRATSAPAAVATSAGLPVQTGSSADSQPPANLPSPVETILATRVAPPTIPAVGTPPPLPVPPEAQQLGQLPPEMNP